MKRRQTKQEKADSKPDRFNMILWENLNTLIRFMGNSKRITTVTLAVLLILFTFAGFPPTSISADEVSGRKEVKQDVKKQKNPYEKAEITIKIIPAENKTFGYDILLYGRPMVHQPSIPGLPGNDGFKTRESAQKVAGFVVKKIRNNEMPPTVTIEDLNSMSVLK